MSLDMIQQVLNKDIAAAAWADDNATRGLKVAKFRRYVDGEHDANMTPEMRKLLRVSLDSDSAPFTSNQCDNIISSVTDRLTVERIEGETPEATDWAAAVMEENRFDGFQMDVHDATLRDADSYVLVEFDNDEQTAKFCHELAWDGSCGMMVIESSDAYDGIMCAIKVWNETRGAYLDTVRVNIYYEDRIEKYISLDGSNLSHYDDPNLPGVWPMPWTYPNGDAIGVPVVHFRNKQRGNSGYGKSELEDALPLQDALNRSLHSLVMVAELTAFKINVAKGFNPPAAIMPGMWLKILRTEVGTDGVTRSVPLKKDDVADAYSLPGGELTQFIEGSKFFIEQIEDVTRTPQTKGTNLSGEAMKQNEVKLLGKVKRFQVKAGNAWEDVIKLAQRVTEAFATGSKPPAATKWRTVWADAQLRNDKEVVGNVMLVKDMVGPEETLRLLSPVFGWTEDDIPRLVAAGAQSQAQRANNILTAGVNPFQ
jgi:SPP1 Gp6-like portal protein